MDEQAARERDIAPGHYVAISVADSGFGMTPEIAARAFDPFFTTKPAGQGTGLGLSMIYGFARQSGGEVRIRSQPGQGTTVRILLPRQAGTSDDEVVQLGSVSTLRAEGDGTVLVVDDEASVRALVAEVLEGLGYKVIEAADGPSGLTVLRSDVRIDLLVSDVGMPGGMNGRQMVDAARQQRPRLRVLFITGYAERAVFGDGEMPVDMHLMVKPFTMQALASRIRELIG